MFVGESSDRSGKPVVAKRFRKAATDVMNGQKNLRTVHQNMIEIPATGYVSKAAGL
jgi:hypothetical protein